MGLSRVGAAIERQRPQLPLWLPVFFGTGIAVYFLLPHEPRAWMVASLAAALALVLAGAVRARPAGRLPLVVIFMIGCGLIAACLRTAIVSAPVLPYEMTAAVEGRIVGLSRSASNAPRLTLDRVVIHGLEPDATPRHVRISVAPDTPPGVLVPGRRVIGTARISPPGGPVEPGGFDFREIAWFDGLGAVGYTRTPMLEMESVDNAGFHQTAFRLRMALSEHIRGRIPGQNGAFAAAILTGDRSEIDRAVEDDLRVSTLYHLVSISGLHMSLLSAAIFALVRYGLALVPFLALNWPLKKIAAVAALIGGGAYLFISGAEVPTQRAYIMTSAFLVAVLLDRPALTLRSVALAAFVVLALAPESLMQAGFQMSFAATIALVAAFEGLRSQGWWQVTQTDRRWRLAKPVIGVAMTSLVAGAVTAPISAFHFNMMAQYGLLANLLAVPAMGAVVMPAAVIAILLAPLSLDWLPFMVAGWGIGYILAVADFVAGLGGSQVGVPAGPGISLGLLAVGGFMLVLWVGRGRWFGLAPMAVAVVFWAAADRPDVLISDNGRLFGVRTETGRALSSDRGNGYAAESWLQNDGDTASQAQASGRGGFTHGRYRFAAELPGVGPILYVGATATDSAAADCAGAAILVAPKWTAEPPGRCIFIGRDELRREGSLAIHLESAGLRIEGALTSAADRPWTRRREDAREAAGWLGAAR